MSAALYFGLFGSGRFVEISNVGGVITFEPDGGSGSTYTGSSMTVQDNILTAAVIQYNPGEGATITLDSPVPLEFETGKIFRFGELNDTNAHAAIGGVPSPFSPTNIYMQLDGANQQWFGDYVIVAEQRLFWKSSGNDYENFPSYVGGPIQVVPICNPCSPTRVNLYYQRNAAGQYLFIDAAPTGADGAWEIDAATLDGPYNISNDELYSGGSPLAAPTIKHFWPYGIDPANQGLGTGVMDDPSSEDNMTGAKGFKRNKGFRHGNGFTEKNGFTKRNGF